MKLSDLKSRIEVLVKTSELLTDRPVLKEDKGNLVSQVETALQTQSLAVVIALASGQRKEGDAITRAVWDETFEVVIHRGLLDGADVPASDDVLDDLRAIIHGARVAVADSSKGYFVCGRHDLRDGGDGTYGRVLTVSITHTITTKS